MRRLVVITLFVITLFAAAGCTFTGPDGQQYDLQKDAKGYYLTFAGNTESFTQEDVQTAVNRTLTAQVKGSIYEGGETVSVFGTCLTRDSQPYPNVSATISAWYPNGSVLFTDTSMQVIQPGYFLYTAPMDVVQGTYLTQMECTVAGSNETARVFGEWQNPAWVQRIRDTQQTVGDINSTVNAINLSNEQILLNIANLSVQLNDTQQNLSTQIQNVIDELNQSVNNTQLLNAINNVSTQVSELSVQLNNSLNQTQQEILQNITQQLNALQINILTNVTAEISQSEQNILQNVTFQFNDLSSTILTAINDSESNIVANITQSEINILQNVTTQFNALSSQITQTQQNILQNISIELNQTQQEILDNMTLQIGDVLFQLNQTESELLAQIGNLSFQLNQNISSLQSQLASSTSQILAAINQSETNIVSNITQSEQNVLQKLNQTQQNLTIQIGNLTYRVDNGFNITWDRLESINATILQELNITRANLTTEIRRAADIANASVDRQDSYLAQLLQNITQFGGFQNNTGNIVNHTVQTEPIAIGTTWDVRVDAFDPVNGDRLTYPDVLCDIFTSKSGVTTQMEDEGNHFVYSEYINTRGPQTYNVTCRYA